MAHRAYAVRWKDNPSWDIKSARATLFRLANPSFRPLSQFAEEATELVHPASRPDHEWPVYGVSNTDGVFFSHHQLGRTFNAPYRRIRRDWFFHNPTRANVGSLGRVPEVPEDAITSPEYQVWRLREGLLPEYVAILIRTRFFLDLIDFHRVGAVKQRLYVSNLLAIPTPVLTEDAQRSLVSAWNDAQAEIAKVRRKVSALHDSIKTTFLAELGLADPEHSVLPKAFAVSRRDLERWSVMFNQLTGVSVDITTGEYPASTLGEVATVSYGIQKCPANRPGQHARPYLRVANVQRDELDLREVKTINVPDAEMPSLRLEAGDLLVCEGNSAELVGRPAMWRGEIPDCVHQNHILKVRLDREQAIPEFVLEYMNSGPARNYFRSRAKFTTNLASINSNDLRELPLPLPPLPTQRHMVIKTVAGREEIAELKSEARQKAEQARADVEAKILRRG